MQISISLITIFIISNGKNIFINRIISFHLNERPKSWPKHDLKHENCVQHGRKRVFYFIVIVIVIAIIIVVFVVVFIIIVRKNTLSVVVMSHRFCCRLSNNFFFFFVKFLQSPTALAKNFPTFF